MKKIIRFILSGLLCCGILLGSSCTTTETPQSSNGSTSETTGKREFVPIVTFRQSGQSGLWADHLYMAANDARKKDYGTYLNENVSDKSKEQKAYLRFVVDTTTGAYTGNEAAVLLKIKSSITKQEMEEYAKEGYKTVSFSILVTSGYNVALTTYYPVFGDRDNDGNREQINNQTKKFYSNTWTELTYPLSWFIKDFGGVEETYILYLPMAVFDNADVYTIYIGEVGLI